MDIAAVKAFFMWCTIINVGLLFLTSLACIFLVDFTYKINSKWFSISRQTFDTVFFPSLRYTSCSSLSSVSSPASLCSSLDNLSSLLIFWNLVFGICLGFRYQDLGFFYKFAPSPA